METNAEVDVKNIQYMTDKDVEKNKALRASFMLWDADLDKFKNYLQETEYVDLHSETAMLKDRQRLMSELDQKMVLPEYKLMSKI